MSPPFIIISLPSMLQRETYVNGLTNYDDRGDDDDHNDFDDEDDAQVIRMNYKKSELKY
jgi:hypothetical protein